MVNLHLTEPAIQKLNSILNEEDNASNHLRIYVEGGGCSGLKYGFALDENVQEDDFVLEEHNIKLLVDSMSYQYLEGAHIDYKNGLEGESFVIRNPNAKTSCGCGSSFSVEDSSAASSHS